MTVTLVVGGVWRAQGEPAGPARAGTDARGAGAPGASEPRRAAPGEPEPSRHPPDSPPRPLLRSRATTLAIPSLRIEAPVVEVELDRRRRLRTPSAKHPNLVGWYEGGPSPGETGTAVVVGHRDTRTGPAVFADLDEIRPGRLVEAQRVDGLIAVYTVDAVRTYEKAHFPDRKVYGVRDRPELRLITCGGRYDRKAGYSSNVVVFAHLTAVRVPKGLK